MVPSEATNPKVKVRLKTRNSRSKERTEKVFEVDAPATVEGQQNQLTELVVERFPEAELRVFHNGAVSFTTEDLHIIAAYVEDISVRFVDRPPKNPSDDDGFEQLPLTA
jgi:hypothetical protein